MAKKNAAKKRPRKSARLRRAPKPKRGSAPSVDDLHAQVRSLTRQLTEAQERETATSEVLKVISNSPGKLEPVFQAMLANAVRPCAAKFGTLWLRDGAAGTASEGLRATTCPLRSQGLVSPTRRSNSPQGPEWGVS